MSRCQHATFCGFVSGYGFLRTRWICFSWLRVSRSNLVRSRVSSLHLATNLPVLDNWVLGFRFVGCLYCFLQHQNPILSSNYIWRKSLEEAEVTYILSRIKFLEIPSQMLSRCNKLGVYRRGWLRSILFDRTSILSVEQAVYRPSTSYLGAHSTFACKMQDVVWSDQALLDLCDPYSWDSRPYRIQSVCPCQNFVLPLSILNLWWSECELIAHPTW